MITVTQSVAAAWHGAAQPIAGRTRRRTVMEQE
jgi:hypothetical protein